MADQKPPQIFGIDAEDWRAAYSESIQEFPATRFLVSQDGTFFRLAFGRNGAPLDEQGGRAPPVYTVAVSIPIVTAIELREVLNRIIPRVEPSGATDE